MSNVALQTVTEVPAPTTSVMTPMAMIDRALATGAAPETLEKLMALQERWEAGEARREFNEAMATAKTQFKPIIKNRHVGYESKKTGDKTDYDYEDLPAVVAAVEPILIQNGLSFRYQLKSEGGTVSVTCIISHRRGHSVETTLSAGADNTGAKNAVQAIGSTVTYLQRYTLKLALGLSAAKDDDAMVVNEADAIDAMQCRYLTDLIETANADERKIIDYVGGDSLNTLTIAQFKKAESALREFMRHSGRRK